MTASKRRARPPALSVVLASLALAAAAWSGGLPEELPQNWAKLETAPQGDVLQFLEQLPHDPSMLGVRAAHLRTKPYPAGPGFEVTTFASLDGTPLAGRLAVYGDVPRPGLVLVPGLTQTKDLKFIVELATLFRGNGWHVLTMDLRGHGDSRRLSPSLITNGWKEAGDILGAVRHLRERSQATSVAVLAFSMGARSLVNAMAQDGGQLIAAGTTVSPNLAPEPPLIPPPPGYAPTRTQRFFLDFLGAPSFHEYYERSARSYGVDLRALEANGPADAAIARVKAPLLVLHALDDFLAVGQVRRGLHDGGAFSLAFRDRVQGHPHVRTLLVDRGGHAGTLYLSDPHWFGLAVLSYLKHGQARDLTLVTVAAPPVDLLAEGVLEGQTVTYRVQVRNHGLKPLGVVEVHLDLPPGSGLGHCWLGAEGLGRCAQDGSRLTWVLPRLAGRKTTAGPFGAAVDVSGLPSGAFTATAWVDEPGALRQDVTLEKP